MVHEAASREQARDELIDRWDRDRQASPDASRIILTHTNAEVRELNEAARDRMREAGDLGEDVRVTVERGERIRGRSPAGRQSTTSAHGPSPTTGPIPFRSQKPRSRCSSDGSATCSMNYSARTPDDPDIENQR